MCANMQVVAEGDLCWLACQECTILLWVVKKQAWGDIRVPSLTLAAVAAGLTVRVRGQALPGACAVALRYQHGSGGGLGPTSVYGRGRVHRGPPPAEEGHLR